MRTTLLALALPTLVACGGGTTAAPADAPSPAAPPPAAETAAPTAPPVAARDPKIDALAREAAKCPRQDDIFDEECPALVRWRDEEELFAEGRGNLTVLALLEDGDPLVREIAAFKGFSEVDAFLADPGNARRVLAAAAKATDPYLAGELGSYASRVDAEKLGLEAELRRLAAHPQPKLRARLTSMITRRQTPVVLELTRGFLADADPEVRRSAISDLSTGGITPPVPEVCKMLEAQLALTDGNEGDALWAGSSSKCPGMAERVMAELEKRVADPSKVTNKVGIGYALAAGGVCSRTTSAELKKRGFAVGVKLTDRTLPDPNTRRAGLSVLGDCDQAAARKPLAALARDKEKFVADGAKEKLGELERRHGK